MANPMTLEILIKTIADSRGIATTEADIKSLAGSMREAAAAGKPLETNADKITEALTKTGSATKKNEQATKGVVDAYADLGRRGNEARDVVEGIGRAATGGAGSIFGLAQATRGFLTLVRGGLAASGPLGILVTVLGVLGGLFFALKDKIGGANKETEKIGTSFKNASEEAKKLQALGFDKLAKELAESATQADRLLGLLKLINGLQEKQDALDAKREKARIDADKKLSPQEKLLRTAEIDSTLTARTRAREDAERAAALDAAQQKFTGSERTAATTEKQLAEQRARVASVQQDQSARNARITELETLLRPENLMRGVTVPDNRAPADVALERAGKIKEELDQLKTRRDVEQSPGAQADFKKQKDTLDMLETAAKSFREAADAAKQAFIDLSARNTIESSALPAIRAGEDAAQQAETSKQLMTLNDADKKEAAGLRQKIQSGYQSGSDTSADLKKLRTIESRLQKATPRRSSSPAGLEYFGDRGAGEGVIEVNGQSVPLNRERPAAGGTISQDGQTINVNSATTVANLREAATHFKTMAEITADIAKQGKKSVDLIKKQQANSREGGGG